ncbi:MAG TPA: gamma-glutamyltransferase [Gemmatimonadaceae bacterium]|nr:gamma-glutamyltransferase [Gemmatimonadaceae bacterium]
MRPSKPARTRGPIALIAALTIAACARGGVAPTLAPDTGKRLAAEHGMVASANPYASEAGLAMLRQGGNAVDAAVAAAFAVGVVEPMMSGLGAGGGMLIWLQDSSRAEYIDFYATAGADPDTALDHYRGSRITARGAGIPGAVAGLLDAQARYGKLPRSAVLAPAIRLAAEGFPVHSLLARVIAEDSAKLASSSGASPIFLPGGHPIAPGATLVQSELASTLRLIAEQGPAGFYRGRIANEIVAALHEGGNPITTQDLAAFEPRWRRPVCTIYRGHTVLSAPPPQSGMQVLEALNLLAPYDLAKLGLPSRSPEAFRVLTAALRVSVTDRNAYVGDPTFSPVPAAGLVSPSYAGERKALLALAPVPDTMRAGNPWPADSIAPTAGCAGFEPFGPSKVPPRVAERPRDGDDHGYSETTHLSAVDASGNAVALTYTNGLFFGSGTWVAGTFLNSAMFNFSRDDSSANARGPHHVPSSTISPTIVLRDGRAELVVGSPGSAAIPPAVVESIIYTLDYGLDPMAALRMPRVIPTWTTSLQLEGGFSPEVVAAAHRLGYHLRLTPPIELAFGGVHLIARVGDTWVGAADPRRDGEVRGY